MGVLLTRTLRVVGHDGSLTPTNIAHEGVVVVFLPLKLRAAGMTGIWLPTPLHTTGCDGSLLAADIACDGA